MVPQSGKPVPVWRTADANEEASAKSVSVPKNVRYA
jgi:hypothetical protein